MNILIWLILGILWGCTMLTITDDIKKWYKVVVVITAVVATCIFGNTETSIGGFLVFIIVFSWFVYYGICKEDRKYQSRRKNHDNSNR